jgi:2-keto-4-pentenoate hydratase/2-oxohepta-3-ene-1,7-dioic acid hydratase in catechol pathway
MRLVTYVPPYPGAHRRVGALHGEVVVDLAAVTAERLRHEPLVEAAAARLASALVPGDMTAFLSNGERGLEAAREALSWVGDQKPGVDSGLVHSASAVQLLAPVPEPPTIRDFNTFEGHTRAAAARMGSEIHPNWFEVPAYYKGTRASIAGPGTVLAWPEPSEMVDLEFEYAAVIGRPAKDVRGDDAMAHLVGFTICNDLSARDLQGREMPLLLGPGKGKDFDGSFVIGPWLVTLDEVGDPSALAMTARINGEVLCETSTGTAYWSWVDILEHASRNETLLPGDVLASGTVAGGALLERGGPFIQPGDVVELEVERLGLLRTTIGPRT